MAEAESNFNLGLRCYNGEGKPQSYEKAAEYFQLAADQGDEDARGVLQQLQGKQKRER